MRSFSVFSLLLVTLLILCGGILLLLVLRDQVVHALSGLPVEEGLPPEHGSELLCNPLEHLLDGSGVAHEGHTHLQSLGWDIADGGLYVVGNPLYEVGGVLVLHVEHLLVNLLGGHSSTEHALGGELSAVSWVCSAHHVLGIECLLGELRDGECRALG